MPNIPFPVDSAGKSNTREENLLTAKKNSKQKQSEASKHVNRDHLGYAL